jgi:amino acid transporter
MNTAVVSALIAKLTAGCGLVLLLPLLTALFGEEPVLPFIYSMALCFLLAAFLRYKGKKKVINLNPRDGLAVTALSWICISILYLFPYFLSGLLSPLDALVESISGLTGTGATVFSDLTVLPKSILFFRSLTHWLGGLGIIVIFVALFPQAGKGSARMIDAESTGPYSSRAVPRIKEMAKALFAVYLLFTVSAALIYTLLGMNFFDAVNHAFSTIATGGFSTKNESIAFYDSTPLKLAVIFFMVISSANFGIYVAAWNPHDMPFYLTMRDSIAVILWAFLGLETACANSDTVENPEKNVPVAVLAGTMIAGVCYMTSTAIIGGLVPHTELVSAGAPFGLAYATMFGNTVGHMVSAMLVVSCFVSLTAWQFTISEVVREAATIGHFPSYLRKVNRFYAPYMAIGTLVCIQSLLTLSTISPSLLKQFNVLINLAVMVNLIPYLLAMAAVPDLQKAEGISAAKAKLPNMAAIIGGVYSVYAVYGCGWDIILYGTLVTVFGIMIYMLKTARLSPAGFQTYPPKK